MKENFKIYLGDSYKLIKQIPSTSIDLILTDPPYNLGLYSTGNIKMKGRKDINNNIAEWDQIEFKPIEWVDEFKRILKPNGNIFVFCSLNLIGEWHKAFNNEFDTVQIVVWHKTNPTPKIFKKGFLNSCEFIMCFWNKGHTWNFGRQKDMHNFIETPICCGSERLKSPHHPTQKPVKILEHIIKIASNKNDIIFDPFMGVGSTGVASLNLGRKFIGIEKKEEYFIAAEKRIKETEQKLNITLI